MLFINKRRPEMEAKLELSICALVFAVLSHRTANGQYTLSTSGSAVRGSSFTFICDASTTSLGDIKWFQNNMSYDVTENGGSCKVPGLPSDYKVTCSSSTHTINLTISSLNFTRHNGTRWACDSFFGGKRSNIIELVVTVPLTSVTLLNASSSSLTVVSGDDITLVCKTNPTTYPTASVTWFKNSAGITQGVTSQTLPTTAGVITIGSLTLNIGRSDNQHRVYCTATRNKETVTSQTVQLNVQVPVSSVNLQNITTNNSDVMTPEGPVILTCETSPSIPAARVTWYKNNSLVTSGVVTKNETDSNELIKTISSITQTVSRIDDNSRWFCRAENIQGQQTLQSNIAVLDVQCAPDVTLDPVETIEGQSATLSCSADGNPADFNFRGFKHYRKTKLIREIPGTKQNNKYQLNLDPTSFQDTGIYVCSVDNGIPDSKGIQVQKSNSSVTVKAKPNFTRDSEKARRVGSVIDSSVTIYQTFYTNPNFTNYTWSYRENGSVLPSDTYRQIVNKTSVKLRIYTKDVTDIGYNATLNILQFRESDIGLYKLTVCNDVGCSVSSVNLSAAGPPTKPSSVKAWSDGPESIKVSWKQEFNGGVPQIFTVQYKTDGDDWKNFTMLPETESAYHETEISNLIPMTVYYVRIVAENKFGHRGFTEDLSVFTQAAPDDPFPAAAIAGALGGVAGLCLIGFLVLVFMRRRKREGGDSKKSLPMQLQKTDHAYADVDEVRLVPRHHAMNKEDMAENVIYEGFDSEPNMKGAAAQSSDQNTKNPSALYAMPQKDKPKEKSKTKGKKAKDVKGDKNKKKAKKDDKMPLKSKEKSAQVSGDLYENVYHNAGTEDKEQASRRNEDGLLYADLDFDNKKPSDKIHQKEEPTEYGAIDFMKKAPSSETGGQQE